MKLFVEGAFESEYSPSVTITEHQKWVDTIQPDLDLLDVALKFYAKMDPWPYECVKYHKRKFRCTNTYLGLKQSFW